MKTFVSLLGFSSAGLTVLGCLFKIMHWPGGGAMLVLGMSTLTSFFCLAYFIYRVKTRQGAVDVIEAFFISASVSWIGIGMMFKVQHWPGAGVMLTAGMTVVVFILLPLLMVKTFSKRKSDTGELNLMFTAIGIAFISLAFAVNTSRNVLHGFKINAKQIEQNNLVLKRTHENLEFDSSDNGELHSVLVLSEEAFALVDSYKNHLTTRVEHIEINSPNSRFHIDSLKMGDNYDIPTNILIGGHEGESRSDVWSALHLKNELHIYRNQLIKMVNSEEAKQDIAMLLAFEDYGSSHIDSWEMQHFYHQPLYSVLNSMNSIQNAILLAETIAIQDLTKNKVVE